MLKIAWAVGAGGQHNDTRVFAILGGELRQAIPHRLKEAGEAPDMAGTEESRCDPRHDHAILQRIACSDRSLGAIINDPHATIRAAGEVRGADHQWTPAGNAQPHTGTLEPGVTEYQLGWQLPLFK